MVYEEILTQSSSPLLCTKYKEACMMGHTAQRRIREGGEMGPSNTEDQTEFLLECCPIVPQQG